MLLLTLVYNTSNFCILLSSVSSSSIFSPNIDVRNGGYRRNTSNMILSLGDSVRCCCGGGGDNKTLLESISSIAVAVAVAVEIVVVAGGGGRELLRRFHTVCLAPSTIDARWIRTRVLITVPAVAVAVAGATAEEYGSIALS